MSEKKDIMDKISEQRERMNPRYDLRHNDIFVIRENSNSSSMYGINCFTYGYIQGYKAAMAELKNKKEDQ